MKKLNLKEWDTVAVSVYDRKLEIESAEIYVRINRIYRGQIIAHSILSFNRHTFGAKTLRSSDSCYTYRITRILSGK